MTSSRQVRDDGAGATLLRPREQQGDPSVYGVGVLLGIWLLVIGLALVVAPIATARRANYLRHVPVPVRPTRSQYRWYRGVGSVIALTGAVIAFVVR
jgi:hypothetical protein